MKRRHTILMLPAAMFAAAQPGTASAQSTELKESDQEAVAFEYRADASKVDKNKSPKYANGQTCSNCSLFFSEAGSKLGGCQLFLGKDVAAIGWCNAWETKAKQR